MMAPTDKYEALNISSSSSSVSPVALYIPIAKIMNGSIRMNHALLVYNRKYTTRVMKSMITEMYAILICVTCLDP